MATPEILPPLQDRILKFKVRQECAGSGKAYKEHLQYWENLAWAPNLIWGVCERNDCPKIWFSMKTLGKIYYLFENLKGI